MNMTSIQEVSTQFRSYLEACQEKPVVIAQNEKPVAVLLYVTDEEELERLILSYSPQFQTILNSAKQRIREGQGIGHETFWEEIEKGID
jgi:PHD/YefM family antitoxin component YafN of YafNO toxin-antitoxin module